MRLTGARFSAGLIVQNPPRSSAWAAVAAVGALLLVFALDSWTGAAPVQHLYYLPIIFAGMRFGGRAGLSAAVAAIVFYHLANPRTLTFHYEEVDVLQMGVFIAAGVISARLAGDTRRLHQLALTDDLTGLHNLRSFEERLRVMVRSARETKTPLSLLVLDMDRLKSLNDVYGHLAGAEAVRLLGRLLADRLPPDSAACRYGGDEFVVALPRSEESAAIGVAESLCRAISGVRPVLAGVPFPAGRLSISVGVATCTFAQSAARGVTADDAAGEELFRAADTALYAAKNGGRNRVSVARR